MVLNDPRALSFTEEEQELGKFAGQAVYQDVVVAALDVAQAVGQAALASVHRHHLDLGAGQVDVARRDVQALPLGRLHDRVDVGVGVGERVVRGLLEADHLDAHSAGQVGLGVQVDEHDSLAGFGQCYTAKSHIIDVAKAGRLLRHRVVKATRGIESDLGLSRK